MNIAPHVVGQVPADVPAQTSLLTDLHQYADQLFAFSAPNITILTAKAEFDQFAVPFMLGAFIIGILLADYFSQRHAQRPTGV